MIHYDKVPWRTIHEYLLDVESATSKREFFSRSLSGIDRLIPADAATGLYDDWGRRLFGSGLSDAENRAYNDYYRFRFPFVSDQRHFQEAWIALADRDSCSPVEWQDYHNSEYVTDWINPHGEARLLVYTDRRLPHRLVLSRGRTPLCPKFSEAERAILSVVSPHLSNLYSCFEKLENSDSFSLCEDEVRERFPQVSRREAQVATLLCRGLTAPEIASKLFLSVRTVESHLGQLYMKLDVRTRREAISCLTPARKF